MNPTMRRPTLIAQARPLPLPLGEGRGEGAHRGFTLVELLVVVAIIAMLMGLLTPVVMRSLAKSRNAAIKAEIDMLHMAIMNYKNEYGSFPPCLSAAGSPSPAANHVARIFPRAASVIATQVPSPINPATALLWWLQGYTTSPIRPVLGEDLDFDDFLDAGEDINQNNDLDIIKRVKLYDHDRARVGDVPGTVTNVYYIAGKPGSLFIYFSSAQYALLDKQIGSVSLGWPAVNFTYLANSASRVIAEGTYFPHRVPASAATTNPWQDQWSLPTRPYFNEDTFQILCAGRDEEFGTDDDLSNFWPGTRQEYLDSLK